MSMEFHQPRARELSAEEIQVKAWIDRLEIRSDSKTGVVAAYESTDASFRILIGVGESRVKRGERLFVLEKHQIPEATNSAEPGRCWRHTFLLSGLSWGTIDPTFPGFVSFDRNKWKEDFIEFQRKIEEGELRDVPAAGLTLYPAPM